MVIRRTDANEGNTEEEDQPTDFFERRQEDDALRSEQKVETPKTDGQKGNVGENVQGVFNVQQGAPGNQFA